MLGMLNCMPGTPHLIGRNARKTENLYLNTGVIRNAGNAKNLRTITGLMRNIGNDKNTGTLKTFRFGTPGILETLRTSGTFGTQEAN